MLKQIPQTRLLMYLLLLGLLPLVFVSAYLMSENGEITRISSTIQNMQHRVIVRENKQAINTAVRQHYRDADHFYIDKCIETLTFLEPEAESLQKVCNSDNFTCDENVKKRLEFITGTNNAIEFIEGPLQSGPSFQETTETMSHPVEVNETDIQKILSRVEGISFGSITPGTNRPQLFILDFKLERKTISEKNEVFSLNMKLLKREFL